MSTAQLSRTVIAALGAFGDRHATKGRYPTGSILNPAIPVEVACAPALAGPLAVAGSTGGSRYETPRGVAIVPTDHELAGDEHLKASLLENQRLREQIKHLMEASNTFGQLAERLNAELQMERRGRAEDRRPLARPNSVSRRASHDLDRHRQFPLVQSELFCHL